MSAASQARGAPNNPWRRRLSAWLPASLRNRVVLFMLLGVLSSQVLVLVLWTVQARSQARTEAQQTAQELAQAGAQAVRFFKALPVQYRPLLVDQLRTTGGARFLFQLNRAEVLQSGIEAKGLARELMRQVRQRLGDELQSHGVSAVVVHIAAAAGVVVTDAQTSLGDLPERWVESAGLTPSGTRPLLVMQAELEPGSWLLLVSALPNPGLLDKANPYAPDRLLLMAAGLLTLLLMVVWMARQLTRSLAGLSRAASAFAREMSAERIPEDEGPKEIRRLARAFNEMQEQIGRAVEDREQLFRSVSHDLQTPIMRLKLRAEMLDDPQVRAGFQSDLQELGTLLKGALTTMRGSELIEPTELVRLDELLHALTSVAMAAQAPLTVRAEPLQVSGKPLALKRALGNLIDNALRYGIRVEIEASREGDCAVVRIRDHGPGVPEAALHGMFKPYLRLEHGMKTNSQGNGLGMWIARNAVRRHGGDIVLRNHPEGGLEALVTLKGLVDEGPL